MRTLSIVSFFVLGAALPGCATTGASGSSPCSMIKTEKTAFGMQREWHKMLNIWVPATTVQFLDSGDKKAVNVIFGAGGLHHDTLAKGTLAKFSIGARVVQEPMTNTAEPVMNASSSMVSTGWEASFALGKLSRLIAADGLNAVRFEIGGANYDIKVTPKQSAEIQRAAACMVSANDADLAP